MLSNRQNEEGTSHRKLHETPRPKSLKMVLYFSHDSNPHRKTKYLSSRLSRCALHPLNICPNLPFLLTNFLYLVTSDLQCLRCLLSHLDPTTILGITLPNVSQGFCRLVCTSLTLPVNLDLYRHFGSDRLNPGVNLDIWCGFEDRESN